MENTDQKANEIRIRYLYRDKILRGEIHLPLAAAIRLIGPDCAYHLYRNMEQGKNSSPTDPKKGKKRLA